ncbi:AI-2E family transporter [Methanofollis fontis]|nr:AI-2E family transporter [Methanofollis fontis]
MAPDLPLPDRLTVYLVLGIFAAGAIAFWGLLWVVILAASIAVVIMPLQRWLSRSIGEASAALISTIAVFFAVFGALGFAIGVLAQNAEYLSGIVQGILAWIDSAQVPGVTNGVSSPDLAEWFSGQFDDLGEWISAIATQVPMLIVDLIVFFLSLYMFVFRGDALAAEITASLPVRLRSAVERMTVTSVDTLYAIYVVHVATSVITFVLAIPFFYVLGYDHILFYALMAALFQLIPILGPSIIMLFLGAYALSLGDIRGAILVALIGYPIVCALPDLYFRPLMMGRRASIHPVIMWIGFFGGLAVMGIVGFVLGPLFLALGVAGYHILVEEMEGVKKTANA